MANPQLSDAVRHQRGTYRSDRASTPQERPSDPDATPSPPRHYAALAARYTAEVLNGTITAGKWTRLACARQQRDLDRAWSDPAWPYVWDRAEVTKVCRFVEQLPHVEGLWATPTITLEPPQIFLLACLFGWRHKADPRRRRFTMLYWEMGRKGAKSTLMAAIALYHLLEEGEAGPQVICGATTGDQARIVFTIAAKMVQRSPWLRARGLAAWKFSITSADGSMKADQREGVDTGRAESELHHPRRIARADVRAARRAEERARARGRIRCLLCPTTAGYDLLSVGYALRTTLTKVLEERVRRGALLRRDLCARCRRRLAG